MSVRMCVCVCLRERGKKKERRYSKKEKGQRQGICVCPCVSMCALVRLPESYEMLQEISHQTLHSLP